MIESYPMDLRRNYLLVEPPEVYNVNALAPLGRAIEVWNARMGREKIGRLIPFARRAIASGDNDTLQHLLKTARNDPHASALIPDGFDMETRSPGHLRVSAPLDDDQLTALYQHPGDVYVRRQIGEAAPGRYAYTMQDGLVTGFEALPTPSNSSAKSDSYPVEAMPLMAQIGPRIGGMGEQLWEKYGPYVYGNADKLIPPVMGAIEKGRMGMRPFEEALQQGEEFFGKISGKNGGWEKKPWDIGPPYTAP
jgi:hypothetical protein